MITKQMIEDRLRSATEQRSRMVAELQTLDGVIQDLEYWLSVEEHKEVASSDPSTTAP